MKIAIAMVQVPFIKGGAEIHADLLRKELIKRGYICDIITIPFKWYPEESILDCMLMGRMLDLTEVNGEKIDMVVAMKFPAYYLKHHNKVIWLLHQHRQAYDLWGTPYGDLHNMPQGENIRSMIIKNDNEYLRESKRIFTNAQNTANRLKNYNNIEAIPLYHPPMNFEKLYCKGFENFIFYPSRIDEMKRQRILVEAARFIKSDIKIYIAGSGSQNEVGYLNKLIQQYNLHDKVRLLGFISEEEKVDYYARCLGVYFGAYDEDYGYITLESFFSRKPIIVHRDAGGPLEFVIDSQNGFILDPEPKCVAEKIDELAYNKSLAERMGNEGYKMLIEKNINWDYVISNLLG